jgi:hypothetical protein
MKIATIEAGLNPKLFCIGVMTSSHRGAVNSGDRKMEGEVDDLQDNFAMTREIPFFRLVQEGSEGFRFRQRGESGVTLSQRAMLLQAMRIQPLFQFEVARIEFYLIGNSPLYAVDPLRTHKKQHIPAR